MALPISAAAIIEKNKLSSDGVWLVLLEIQVPGLQNPLYFVRNNDPITWNGQTFEPFPFDMDDGNENSKGETPSLTVRVSNITLAVQSYLESAGGGVGSIVTIRVVHSKHLDITAPEVKETFSVVEVSADRQWVYFNLGPSYPVNSRRPLRRYFKNFCPYPQYGGIECGVPDAVKAQFPDCSRTLAACKQRGNSKRFGGEQAIQQGGLYA